MSQTKNEKILQTCNQQRPSASATYVLRRAHGSLGMPYKRETIIFLEGDGGGGGGGGMKNTEKNCLHDQKRQNKSLVGTICVKKISLHFEKKNVCRDT